MNYPTVYDQVSIYLSLSWRVLCDQTRIFQSGLVLSSGFHTTHFP